MRRFRVLLLAASLLAPTLLAAPAAAQDDDDWSVTRHPGGHPRPRPRPSATPRPSTGPRPVRPSIPRPTAAVPATTDPAQPAAPPNAARDRRNRMITALTQSVLRGAADDAAPLAVLMRLVRERDGSIDALVTDFEARARAAGTEVGPHLALGHLYREAGRYEDALREYAAAERLAPANPAPARAAGALYRRMDRTADARAACERALARTTDRRQQTDTLRELMELALVGGDVPGARSFHQRLVALDRASMTVRRELADALLSRHLYVDAVAEYQALARALAGDNRVLPPVLRDLGRAYAGNNQPDEALAAFRRALAVAGADAGIRRELYDAMTEVHRARNALPAWIAELERMGGRDGYERAVLLGQLHQQAGNAMAAIAAYRRALASRPNDVDVHRDIAQIYHEQGMIAEQIAEYRRLITLAPHDAQFVGTLAALLVGQGQTDEALRMLAAASARAGGDPQMHERLAGIYQTLGRQQDVLRETQLVARFDPTSPAGLIMLAQQQMELDQRDHALATIRRMVDTSRDRARGEVAAAEWYADNAMLPEAIESYREAVRLRPNEVDFHRGLATVLESARQFDNAVSEWRRVIALAPLGDRDVRRHAREAVVRVWGLQGRLAQQIPVLEAAFAQAPPDVEAGRDLALALVRAHRPEDADRVLARVTTLDPSDVASLMTLEQVRGNRGDLAGAITVLRRLVEADPRRARDWYQRMAQHALALHRDEEAIEYATHAVQLNDQDATAHLRLAELYRARNDLGHAIAALRRALELNDRLYPTYFELADLYLGYRNEPREAIGLYRRVITLGPTDDDYINRAGRQAIQIAPAAGLGDEVERDLVTASSAAPTRAVFRRLLVAYYDATARPLINRVQQGTLDDATRARAELTRIGARAIAPLLGALSDPDPAQQRIALDILGYLGNPNATSALIAVAEGNADTEIKRRALAAAGALGDARALPRLIALQTGQADATLATIATWALAHVHAPAATAVLLRALAVSSAPEVRTMAALGLGGTRDARARAALRGLLSPETDSGVRAAAAYALGSGIDRQALTTLTVALETGAPSLRAAAAAALGQSGDQAVAPAALARALFSPYAEVRRASARGLTRLAGGSSVATTRVFDDPVHAASGTAMLTALLDPPDVPIDGAAALVRYRRELTEAARDALSGVRERVVAALGALVEPGGLAPLALPETMAAVPRGREALAGLVVELVPALGNLVTHSDVNIRRSALRILASVEAPTAMASLARAAADDDEGIAVTAMAALARRTDDPAAAFDAINARLSHAESSWGLRTAAATALGTTGDPRAAARLIAVLGDDPFEYVRVAAARALRGHLQRDGVRAALTRAAQGDVDASVRQAAREALQ